MGLLWFRKWKAGRVRVLAAGLILVLVVVAVVLGSSPAAERVQSLENLNEPSWMSRVMVWKGTLGLIGDHPWLGTGPGTFPWSFPAYRPPGLSLRFLETHNDYLQAVSELGLWVLIPLIWGAVLLFREGLSVYFKTTSRLVSGLALGGICALASILVHSGGDFNLQITSNGIFFSFVAGLVMAAQRLHLENHERLEARQKENGAPLTLVDSSGETVYHHQGDASGRPDGSPKE
jgi:O-antigen ligase